MGKILQIQVHYRILKSMSEIFTPKYFKLAELSSYNTTLKSNVKLGSTHSSETLL